jgi:hypothetical protein
VLRGVRRDFDKAAQTAAMKSRWEPMLLKGKRVGAVVMVSVEAPKRPAAK